MPLVVEPWEYTHTHIHTQTHAYKHTHAHTELRMSWTKTILRNHAVMHRLHIFSLKIIQYLLLLSL